MSHAAAPRERRVAQAFATCRHRPSRHPVEQRRCYSRPAELTPADWAGPLYESIPRTSVGRKRRSSRRRISAASLSPDLSAPSTVTAKVGDHTSTELHVIYEGAPDRLIPLSQCGTGIEERQFARLESQPRAPFSAIKCGLLMTRPSSDLTSGFAAVEA